MNSDQRESLGPSPGTPARLIACKTNPRTHAPKQVCQIAESIRKFGFIVPVLVNAQNQIVAAHGRVEAAKLLGLTEVPVLRVSHLSPAEQRAFVIADNRLAELAGWDRDQDRAGQRRSPRTLSYRDDLRPPADFLLR